MNAALDDRALETLARRVADLLRDDGLGRRLIDAAEVARRLGVARSTVYEKADELGAIRIGTGPRARLRFDPRLVEARMRSLRIRGGATAEPRRPIQARRRRQTAKPPAGLELLPIRGERAR